MAGAVGGVFGREDVEAVRAMLRASSAGAGDVAALAGATLGWSGDAVGEAGPGGLRVATARVVAGGAPTGPVQAGALDALFAALAAGDPELDGRLCAARWDGRAAEAYVDPMGIGSLFWLEHDGALWFASELRMLRASPAWRPEVDPVALHLYLTFSCVPGDRTGLMGVRKLGAGQRLRWADGGASITAWASITEAPTEIEQGPAARRMWRVGRRAVERRLAGAGPVGLYLSGGVDSSAVGAWLVDLGADVEAFTLDFGDESVEREEAQAAAAHLGLRQRRVVVDAAEAARAWSSVIASLELPFGDAVTVPQALLAEAARAEGRVTVFNGEGGDQLLGGWTTKPMIAAALYGGEDPDHAAWYLKSFHRFYGLEEQLYTPAFAARVGPVGQRRAILRPWVGGDARYFLNRLRLTDLYLKGTDNIVPRAARIGAAAGLEVAMPLFDRELAQWTFRLPPHLKLRGASEKQVLKLAMQGRLPDALIWRRKSGMSVPVTTWLQGGMRGLVDDLLSEAAVRRRGWFKPTFVQQLRDGWELPGDVRRRRWGERVWALMVLESWAREHLDAVVGGGRG